MSMLIARPCVSFVLLTTVVAIAQAPGKEAPAKEVSSKELSSKEQDQLVAQFLAADDRTAAGHAARVELLDRIATLPALDERALATWRQKIAKIWSKGHKLELGGDNWYWPEDKKRKVEQHGRYLVGGQTRKPKGLAINMHGGGIGAGDAGGAAAAYQDALAKLDLLMIAPEVLEKTEHGWTDAGTEEFVLSLVDDALRTWKIDADNVFFVGHSMGGYGSWTLGAHHADRVAAIAPSAGAPTPQRTRPGGPIVAIDDGVLPSLRNVFVSIYQSRDDVQVPPDANQAAARLLGEAKAKWGGFEYVYWEVDGRGHGEPPGGYIAQLTKVVEHHRQVVPERVVWQPVLAWKRQFYWLYWDAPVAGAIVVADLDKVKNTVTITCDKPTAGLYVLLDERVLDLGKDIVVTVNGAETFRGRPTPELAALLLTSDHPDRKLQFVARAPAFAKDGGKDG